MSSFREKFEKLIEDINKISSDSLQQGNLTNDHFLQFRWSDNEVFRHPISLMRIGDTPLKLLSYMVRYRFIHYLNVSLINEIFSGQDSTVRHLVNNYSNRLQTFLDETEFSSLNELFQSHPEYIPMADTADWPKLLITLEEPFTSLSVHRWNQILQEQFEWFSLIVLVNVTSAMGEQPKQRSVILEYLVLPIDRIINNPEMLMLKYTSSVLNYIGVSKVDYKDYKLGKLLC